MNANIFFDVICNAVEVLGIKTYLGKRPQATTKNLDCFLVVALPSRITDKEIGGCNSDFNWSETTAVFELFVRDDVQADNPIEAAIIELNDKVEELKALFPIADLEQEVEVCRPRVIFTGKSDGNGFHYTRVHAQLSTMV